MRLFIAVLVMAGCAGAQGQAVAEHPAASSPLAFASASAPGSAVAALTQAKPVIPDAPSYIPLTGHEKFEIFLRQTYSPYTFANTAFDAGWAQLTDDWPAYGQGMEGYGKRYGALLANHEAGVFFESFLLPTLLHQDPRYFRAGPSRGVLRRLIYATSRVAITRGDDGAQTFNSSHIAGMLLVDGLTNAYYPRPQRGFGDTMSRFEGGLISSAQTNLLREFWPDIVHIFRKHEPEKLKELEKKMPLSAKFTAHDDGSTVQPEDPIPQNSGRDSAGGQDAMGVGRRP
jgi:hypothetical protein